MDSFSRCFLSFSSLNNSLNWATFEGSLEVLSLWARNVCVLVAVFCICRIWILLSCIHLLKMVKSVENLEKKELKNLCPCSPNHLQMCSGWSDLKRVLNVSWGEFTPALWAAQSWSVYSRWMLIPGLNSLRDTWDWAALFEHTMNS